MYQRNIFIRLISNGCKTSLTSISLPQRNGFSILIHAVKTLSKSINGAVFMNWKLNSRSRNTFLFKYKRNIFQICDCFSINRNFQCFFLEYHLMLFTSYYICMLGFFHRKCFRLSIKEAFLSSDHSKTTDYRINHELPCSLFWFNTNRYMIFRFQNMSNFTTWCPFFQILVSKAVIRIPPCTASS